MFFIIVLLQRKVKRSEKFWQCPGFLSTNSQKNWGFSHENSRGAAPRPSPAVFLSPFFHSSMPISAAAAPATAIAETAIGIAHPRQPLGGRGTPNGLLGGGGGGILPGPLKGPPGRPGPLPPKPRGPPGPLPGPPGLGIKTPPFHVSIAAFITSPPGSQRSCGRLLRGRGSQFLLFYNPRLRHNAVNWDHNGLSRRNGEFLAHKLHVQPFLSILENRFPEHFPIKPESLSLIHTE